MPSQRIDITIEADDKATPKITKVKGTVDDMGTSATNMSANMITAMNQAASAMINIGSMITDATGDMVSGFASFDQSMFNTQSILRASGAEFEALNQKAIDIGETMPVSAREAAEGFYTLASAGIETNDILANTEQIMKGAVAGATDFDTAAGIVTATLGAFGSQGYEVNQILDIMLTTVQRGRTTFAELADTMPFVASAAAGAGVSLEDLGAAIDNVRNAGIPASMAGTSLAMVLTKLSKPTENAITLMDKYGIEMKKNKDGGLDLVATMVAMADSLSELPPGLERTSVMQELFGIRGAKAAIALMQNTDALQENRKAMEQSGVTTKAYEVQMQGAENQLKLLEGRLENAKIMLGEQLLPAQVAVNEAEVWFYEGLANLNPELLKYGGALVMVAGNLFNMLGPILQMIVSIKSLIVLRAMATTAVTTHTTSLWANMAATVKAAAAQWLLNTAMYANPVFWLIGGIVALTAVLYIFQDEIGAIGDDLVPYTMKLIGVGDQYDSLNRTLDKVNLMIGTQKDELHDLRNAYNDLTEDLMELDEVIGADTRTMRENELLIRQMERAAEKRGSMTELEAAQIRNLKEDNKDLSLIIMENKLSRDTLAESQEKNNALIKEETEDLKMLEDQRKRIQKQQKEMEALMWFGTGPIGALIASYQGGGIVPEDQIAKVHKGEIIIDPAHLTGGSGGDTFNTYTTENNFYNTMTISGGGGEGVRDPVYGRRTAEEIMNWMEELGGFS